MMKSFKILFILSIIWVSACQNNSEEAEIDCSQSDLSVSVVTSVKSDCQIPGSFEVVATGGEEPYQYSLDGIDFQQSTVFDDLYAGNYEISVQDNLGCTSTSNFTLESEPTGITLNLSSSETSCSQNEGSITAEASGGTGTLVFALGEGTFSEERVFVDLEQGAYEVSVKDEEDCVVTKNILVRSNTSLLSDVMPIIDANCAVTGCHNGSQAPRLQTADEIIENADRIKTETQARTMPRDGTLSQEEIDLIACWVDDGANEN